MGIGVVICGKPLRTTHNLICTLPIRHLPHHIHVTTAIAENNAIVAIVDNLNEKEAQMWQLVGPPE